MTQTASIGDRPVGVPSPPSQRMLNRMALALLLLGALWRTARYLLGFPIWGDEALLATNLVNSDFAQLTHGITNAQLAPLLFLWGEKAVLRLFGPGELAMRLIPFLAGVGSLVLFWRLTDLMLAPWARFFTVGFFAVAPVPVAMSALMKPYSLDLFMSLLLLVPAAQWLRARDQTRWLLCLTCLTPVALLGSYPAVLVAGAVGLVLALPTWRHGPQSRLWFALFTIALLVSFAVAWRIGNNQLDQAAAGVTTRETMNAYWAYAFPPSALGALLWWFALLTAGQMSAYPIGAANGGSILTVLCGVIGATHWWRQRQWPWLALSVAPLFLSLFAAILHKYPYGAAARLSQYLAPGICILAGLGLSVVVEKVEQRNGWSARWILAVAAFFALISVAGLVLDIVRPYRDRGSLWMRTTMNNMRRRVGATDPVVICDRPGDQEIVFSWYWLNEGKRVTWDYQLPSQSSRGDRMWGFKSGAGTDEARQRLSEILTRNDPAWHLATRVCYSYQPRDHKGFPQQCELFCFRHSPP